MRQKSSAAVVSKTTRKDSAMRDGTACCKRRCAARAQPRNGGRARTLKYTWNSEISREHADFRRSYSDLPQVARSRPALLER